MDLVIHREKVWVENTPYAPAVEINDYVVIWDGRKQLSGYIVEKGLGWIKIYHGPVAPISSVLRFIPRHGKEFNFDSTSHPITHF